MPQSHEEWTVIECSSSNSGMFDLWSVSIPEDARPGYAVETRVVPTGTWNHPKHGPFVIDASVLSDMVANFNANLPGPEIPFQFVEHQRSDSSGAYGWIDSLRIADDGLWASIRLTDIGLDILRNRRFRFLSPEMAVGKLRYPDELGGRHANVLSCVSPTNSPLFRVLTKTPLAASADGGGLGDEETGDEQHMPNENTDGTVEASASPGAQFANIESLMASMNDFRQALEAANTRIGELQADKASLTASINELRDASSSLMAANMVDSWKFSVPTVVDGQAATMTAVLSPAHKELVLKMLSELSTDVGAEFIKCMSGNGFDYVTLGETPTIIAASAGEADPGESLDDEYPDDIVNQARQYMLAHPGLKLQEAVNSVLAPPWAK